MDPFLFVAIPLVGVLLLGLMVWFYLAEKRRREALAREAEALGLRFEARPSEDLVGRLSSFHLMRQGFARRAFNVLTGEREGVAVRLFDYEYQTQSSNGKTTSTQTHRFSVVVARLPRPFGRIGVEPENWGHKLWDALGGDDIDFESDEFSRKFWVKADNRREAYDLIHPRMMEFLLACPRKHWQVVGDLVMSARPGRHGPQDCRPIVEAAVGFVRHVPEHLVEASRVP